MSREMSKLWLGSHSILQGDY